MTRIGQRLDLSLGLLSRQIGHSYLMNRSLTLRKKVFRLKTVKKAGKKRTKKRKSQKRKKKL